tara:strand:+ start:82 stop:237 length:156 start_codon:yes stop_codon:yes gene_type:complete
MEIAIMKGCSKQIAEAKFFIYLASDCEGECIADLNIEKINSLNKNYRFDII